MTPDARSGIAPPGYRLPVATRLGRVRLQVGDLERSEAFYSRVLGLEAVDRSVGGAVLRAPGGTEALVELVARPGARPLSPRGRPGLYHYALLLPDRAELGRFAAHLAEIGHRFGSADHRVSEALYLTDPDGLGIEVYADRPRARWSRSEGGHLVMTTEPLDLADLTAAAGGRSFRGLSPDTVVGHIHLHVADLGEAAHFYHEALGFDKTVWNYPGALFLSAGGYHHHVGTNTWAAAASPAGPDDARLLSWTLIVPTSAELEEATASLTSAGFRVEDVGGRRLTMDPSGTAVELVAAGEGERRSAAPHPRSARPCPSTERTRHP